MNLPSSTHYDKLIARAQTLSAAPCAIAHPCDEPSLSPRWKRDLGLLHPILVGPERKIRDTAAQFRLNLGDARIVDAPHSHAAAETAVALVRAGEASLLMKGSLHTDELMHEVVARTGLRSSRRISHVFIMEVPTYPEPLFITDAAINIFPDLETKADIIRNVIDLHHGLGLGEPRVAILSAVEQVTPSIPSTIEAAALCKMADRGQIAGGLLDGPLALDNAISPDAARIKGIRSHVAGVAQVLVVPDLEAGNMLAKNLTFLANAEAAGIVLGARVPIILTSRADSRARAWPRRRWRRSTRTTWPSNRPARWPETGRIRFHPSPTATDFPTPCPTPSSSSTQAVPASSSTSTTSTARRSWRRAWAASSKASAPRTRACGCAMPARRWSSATSPQPRARCAQWPGSRGHLAQRPPRRRAAGRGPSRGARRPRAVRAGADR